MTWNHRVVRRRDADGTYVFGIHEAYYDAHGRCYAVTAESVAPIGSTPEELNGELMLMKSAAKRPVLCYEDVPERGAIAPGTKPRANRKSGGTP